MSDLEKNWPDIDRGVAEGADAKRVVDGGVGEDADECVVDGGVAAGIAEGADAKRVVDGGVGKDADECLVDGGVAEGADAKRVVDWSVGKGANAGCGVDIGEAECSDGGVFKGIDDGAV